MSKDRKTEWFSAEDTQFSRDHDHAMPDYASVEKMIKELDFLRRDNNLMKERIAELEKAADTDPLLPIFNRRAFVREIDKARSVMGRYDILSSLIYLDLDNFKSINDSHGHAAGDDVLRMVSSILTQGVRPCDLVARLGGDEFGVLLFKTDKIIAQDKARELARQISQNKLTLETGQIVQVKTSWGIASCQTEDSADQIMARADQAMYLAKSRAA